MKLPFRPALLSVFLLVFALPSFVFGDEEKRFVAMLEDGRIVEDDVLRNWYSGNAMPQLAGQSLIHGNNPMRWMIDRSLGPAEMPNAYIELFSGDRIPGHTNAYSPASVEYQVDVPEYFTVTPSFSFRRSPDSRYRSDVRVKRDFVRKIVWQQQPSLIDRHVPATVFLKNGREISFRAIRFSEAGVHLLSGRERMTIGFHEVAEIHLENESVWEKHLDELAILFPDGKTEPADQQRLVQWETSDGLVATTCVQRIDADSRGDNNNSDRWVHGIQPAWSLDPIWVECRSTWIRRSWPMHEMPLFRLPFQENRSKAMFSRNGFSARVNRGILAGTAKSGERASGWNFGVMAPSELSFTLPPIATGFQTFVGIDQAAHDRGCIRGLVKVSWESSPKFQSESIVGSEKLIDAGNIHWGETPKNGQLILEADMAHESRPDGADPFDIRDMTNWIEPRIELDKEKLRQAIYDRTPRTMLAWQGWTLESEREDLKFQTIRRRVEYAHEVPSWRETVIAKNEPLRLSMKKKIDPDSRYLEVNVSKFDGVDEVELGVLVNGIPVLEQPLKNTNTHDHVNSPPPMLVDLAPFMDSEATIELTQSVGPDNMPIDWRGITFSAKPSFLRPVLDAPSLADIEAMKNLDGESVDATWRNEIRLVSRPAVEIADGPWVQIASFDQPIEIRERPLPGQFRQMRFAFQKRGKGYVQIRLLHANDAERPAIYSVATSKAEKGVVELQPKKVEEDLWEIAHADIFSNFGEINIDGIAIQSIGEGSSVWDQMVISSSASHYDRLVSISPINNRWDDWQKRSDDLLPRLMKATVEIKRPKKSPQSAILFDINRGLFATLGDDDWKRGETIEIIRDDGKTFQGKCLGMDPESKFAIAQIEKVEQPGEWAHFDLNSRDKFDPQFAYMVIQANEKPDSLSWDICRPLTFTKTYEILSAPEPFACQVGAIVIDRDHKIAGFVVALTPSGAPVLAIGHPLTERLTTLTGN